MAQLLSLVLTVFCLALAGLNAYAAQPQVNDARVIRVEKAVLVELDTPGQATDIGLPFLKLRSARIFKRFRLQADFSIPDTLASSSWAVYFTSMSDGGTVSVNGTDIGNVQTSTPDTTVRHVQPYMFYIPPSLLQNGTNRVEVKWATRETMLLVSRIFVGPT